MSGYTGSTPDSGAPFAELGVTGGLGSALTQLLLCEEIVPGSPASYQICKTIFSFHPLGEKLVGVPIRMAQSQAREIDVPGGPERLIKAFNDEWKAIGAVGADALISNVACTARIYGIGSIIVGNRGDDMSKPIEMEKLHELDLYFNVLDPLNTAGSLVLNQDPNSPDFQKPQALQVGSTVYHPSRSVVMMNEKPIYIQFSDSAFGFSGRSVYQRALYPLKTFLQTMITDQWITQKCGLLVWNAVAPGSIINQRIANFFGFKRNQIKAGVTGNVLTIAEKEIIASLNLQNLEGPAAFARGNCIKNTATSAGMPAILIEQEAMVDGFGEGTEDAKQIARYIDGVRIEMNHVYSFFDRIVQRRAWSPDFYKTVQRDYPEYRKVPYETAFYQWSNAFTASWPNLLSEPESEKVKTEEVRFNSVVKLLESIAPMLPQEEKAKVIMWAAEEINSRRQLFSAPLVLDEDAIATYEPPVPMEEPETEPRPQMEAA